MEFNREDQLAIRINKLNSFISQELNTLANETKDSSLNINTLMESNKLLQVQLEDLQRRHTKLQQDYSNSLDAMDTIKSTSSTPTSIVAFDPAIHTHKPMRPITNKLRLEILDAYQNVYKQHEDCKTLTDFFTWIQSNICHSASRSEIEGVIYNRFDERLYQ